MRDRRDRRGERRKSRSRSRSSLSYSPLRRHPECYRDILLEEGSRQREGEGAVDGRKAARLIAPRVSLRESSEEENEVVYEDEARDEEEERLRELDALRRLQSGLAAKARESLSRKANSPVKVGF